jgi:myo-inositol-1(or 4)-monophosphatase
MPTVPTETLEEWLDIAVAIGSEAGRALVHRFEVGVDVEQKSNHIDLVTEADREAERIIVGRLTEAFPDHGILAEESGSRGNDDPAALRWTVDPLDGTTNFAHGYPHFSVLLALYRGSEGLLSVTVDPMRAETFVARAGSGAWLHRAGESPRRLSVTGTDGVERSLLATGFAYDRATAERNNMAEFGRLIHRVRGIRRAGSAGLDMAWVAAGRLDGYWEYHLSPWDWSAGALLIREAGGVVQTIGGEPWAPGDDSLATAGPALIEPLQSALDPGGR